MRIRYILILLACLFYLPLSAQQKKCNETEFQTKKQAYMAKQAGLTPDESKKFFPLYFEFQSKKRAINKQIWKKAKQNKELETTEAEYEEIVDNFFDNQEEILQLEKEYIQKYRQILSDKKIYMIYWAEFKFSRNMMKILQEMDDEQK